MLLYVYTADCVTIHVRIHGKTNLCHDFVTQVDNRARGGELVDERIGVGVKFDTGMLLQQANVEHVCKGAPHGLASGVVEVAHAKLISKEEGPVEMGGLRNGACCVLYVGVCSIHDPCHLFSS